MDDKLENSIQDPGRNKEFSEDAFLILKGMVYPINKKVFKIGRHLDNDLVLNDPTVSRFHAEIHYSESQFILVDQYSSAGTYLNYQKIIKQTLFAGDIIQISNNPIMFMYKGASMLDKSRKNTGLLKG